MPTDTNYTGNLFGGRMLEWMDELAGITARRFAKTDVMTVAIENVTFKHPMPNACFLDMIAEVIHVGNTSMKIKITVKMDQNEGQEQIQTAEAFFIFVALDENRRPKKIERA